MTFVRLSGPRAAQGRFVNLGLRFSFRHPLSTPNSSLHSLPAVDRRLSASEVR
jgi:hypothetical protein